MATQRSTFAKLQRERDKKAKAAEKRDRRLEAAAAKAQGPEDDGSAILEGTEPLSAAELIKAIELVHGRFEAKEISFEEFEEQKADLLARLPLD